MSPFQRVKPSGFEFVPGTIFDCQTVGQAKHDIDLEQEFRATYGLFMGLESFNYDAWVDPVSGSDSNDGIFFRPYKTLKKAYQKPGVGTIWLKPGTYTERFDVQRSDNALIDGEARAIMVKALAGLGTVVFRSPGQQPSEMTWVADTNGFRYEATPAGGETAQTILFKHGNAEFAIPYRTALADLNNTGHGWYQDPSTKRIYIRYENRNINNDKAKFEIMYRRSANLQSYGAVTFLKDIIFRGDAELDLLMDGSHRSVLYAKNCKWEYLSLHNIHTEGAIIFTQNCVTRRATVGDGFNYYDSGSTPTWALEVDNVCIDNGVQESVDFVSNSVRNKQGSSGHGTSKICRINGVYSGNFGQNIADTGEGSSTWMIGCELLNPYGEIGGGATLGGYHNMHVEGTNWLDNVKAGGRLSTYGLWCQSGTTHLNQCSFSGTTADVGGDGTMTIYNPAMP